VLITLAIIGVVAAITIPNLVANHRKREFETRLAKTYQTLSQALNLAIAEHGDVSSWDWKNSPSYEQRDDFIKKYFVPYLNVIKFCTATQVTDCRSSDKAVTSSISGQVGNSWNIAGNPKIILSDGALVNFYITKSGSTPTISIYVDTNGSKKPNVYGYDVFHFSLSSSKNRVTPTGAGNLYEKALDNCLNGNGLQCGGVAFMDGFKIKY